MSELDVDLEGFEDVQANLARMAQQMRMGSPAFTGVMQKATLLVTRAARINAPVDTGRLRASITPEVREGTGSVVGVVGSIVEYAPHVEQPGPVRRTGRRPYLEPALRENRNEILRILNNVTTQIIRENSNA